MKGVRKVTFWDSDRLSNGVSSSALFLYPDLVSLHATLQYHHVNTIDLYSSSRFLVKLVKRS